MTDPAISIAGLTKVFPPPLGGKRVTAVENLSLEIRRGQIYGLLGPNGSGKSTTLKAIMNLVWPSAGTIRIFGRDSREVASRAAVGFLPENPYFHKFLSGRETLMFYGRLAGLGGNTLRARAEELLALAGLEQAAARRLSTYSKGMLQRIGLAQALINEPQAVILDEPTAGVDPAGAVTIRDLLLRLRREGVTVLLSSHLLSQVQEICDRIAILAGGRLVREGTLEELLAQRHRTELVLENASPELVRELRALAENRGAAVVREAHPRETLERVFLEATSG